MLEQRQKIETLPEAQLAYTESCGGVLNTPNPSK